MRADPNNQIVFPGPANCVGDVKYRGCEAGKVFSDHLTVQPNFCTKLSFIDAQDSDAALSRYFKPAVIPEPVALLSRYPSISNQSSLRQLTLTNAVLDKLPTVEEVNISESRGGGMSEPRDRCLVIEVCRQRVSGFGIGDVPFTVQRQGGALGRVPRHST